MNGSLAAWSARCQWNANKRRRFIKHFSTNATKRSELEERSAFYRVIKDMNMKFCEDCHKLPTSLSNFFCQVKSLSLFWPENQIRSPTKRAKFSRNIGHTKPAQPALEESPCEGGNSAVKERFSPTLRRLGPKWSVAARKTEKNKKWSDGNFSKRR